MTTTDVARQHLIADSIQRIVAHEDPELFFRWIRSAIPTYHLFPVDQTPNETAWRAIAMALGRAIWNATPLPGNGFRPRPLAKAERNDPCPCGSKKKHKKCCGGAPAMPEPEIDPDVVLPLVLQFATPEQQQSLSRAAPAAMDGLLAIAQEELDDGHPKKAARLLEPIFENEIPQPRFEHGLALWMLCRCYHELGFHGKERAVLERIIGSPARTTLRAEAALWLCERKRLDGDISGARAAWQQAQRDDPDLIGLGVTEVQLLLDEGCVEAAIRRATHWKKRREGLSDSGAREELRTLASILHRLENLDTGSLANE